jgi:heme-degrading monooxygenase HmoA
MYGTVAVCHVRPENFAKLQAMAAAEDYQGIDGYIGTDLLAVDNHPDTVLMVVRFRDQDAYRENAESVDQDARYRDFRALMEDDPVWYDGDWVRGL